MTYVIGDLGSDGRDRERFYFVAFLGGKNSLYVFAFLRRVSFVFREGDGGYYLLLGIFKFYLACGRLFVRVDVFI